MIFIKLIICVVSLFPAAIILADKDDTLKLPEIYEVEGNANNVLEGFELSFKGWYDKKAMKSRFEYNGGEVNTYQLSSGHIKIVPAHSSLNGDFNSTECYMEIDDKHIQSAFPDASGFEFKGNENITEKIFKRYERVTNKTGEPSETVTMKETLWMSSDSADIPFRYENRQYNYDDKANYLLQHYYLEYLYFEKKEVIDPKVFKPDPNQLHQCNSHQITGNEIVLNPLESFIPKPTKEPRKENSPNHNSYRQNLGLIDSVNRAGLGYKLAVNQFAYKTPEELRKMFDHSPLLDHEPIPVGAIEAIPDDYLPNELDWRERGEVTPVRSQGASCAADGYFAVVGAVEGAHYLNTGELRPLSAKVLMDCSWKDNTTSKNEGCYRNSPVYSFDWIIKTGGLPHEGAYRTYSPIEGYCEKEPLIDLKQLVAIANYTPVAQNSTLLKKALLEHGPLVVRIQVPMSTFLFYSEGIFNCATAGPKVSVYSLLIGYGIFQGQPYWLLKMSYGLYWGVNGYIMIDADPVTDSCQILKEAYYVTVKNKAENVSI